MKQISNLLGPNHYNMVRLKLDSQETPWYRSTVTANFNDPVKSYGSSFSHLIYSRDKGGQTSDVIDIALPILLSALDRQNLELRELYRVRLGMLTRVPFELVHPPHVDNPEACPQPHTVGLYYITASDGDTIIYNETKDSESYTEQARSTPSQNSWIDFDGKYYHSSTCPQKHEQRVVITFNYTSAISGAGLPR